jgi:hypothetical protein
MRAAEHTLDDFAEDLGRVLGQAQRKAESWLSERKAIAARLVGLRDAANELIAQLGGNSLAPNQREPLKGAPAPRRSTRRRRTISVEGRARIAAAQRERWARQRAGKK